MQKFLLTGVFVFLLSVSAPQAGWAHPHMLMKTRLEIDFDGNKCKGVRVQWSFDRFFSSSIIQDYDSDRDGKFSSREIRDIHDYAFINLKNYGFFVYLRKGSERFSPSQVTEFTAWHENGTLFYSFYIPLGEKDYSGEFHVSIFDPTYFCEITYEKDPVRINQKTGKSPGYVIEKNTKFPVYYNPSGAADDTRTYDKWAPGLETAYPEEVRIHF